MYEQYLISFVVLIYIDIYDRLCDLCISSSVSLCSLPTVDYVGPSFSSRIYRFPGALYSQ